MDPRIARRVGELADRGHPFAVCAIVQATGSVPAKAGSAMIVHPDGRAEGTVGGAGLEERVKRAAVDALRKGERGALLRFDLANWKEGGLDSVCGGTVDVALHVVNPAPHLLLYGGGHCAKALADACDLLGWGYTVVDARAEYASADRFPGARATHGGTDPAKWTEQADLSGFTHAYVLGHSHHVDTDTLVALLPRFHGFVGVIGSRAKRVSMFDRALKAGVPEELLARVKCPIGLDIGAETPAEIAVAVAAEVIADLRKRG